MHKNNYSLVFREMVDINVFMLKLPFIWLKRRLSR
jgi:hypothetical protein